MAQKNEGQNKDRGSSEVSPITLQKNLAGVDYPANRQQLIEAAEGNGAPENVLDILNELPDEDFSSPKEVMKAFSSVYQSHKAKRQAS